MRRNYQDPAYKTWRLGVYKRDGFRCQMPVCGSKFKVQAHHIKKWSEASTLRYDVRNGITLCRTCHDSISGVESHYEVMFTDIVSSKYGKSK